MDYLHAIERYFDAINVSFDISKLVMKCRKQINIVIGITATNFIIINFIYHSINREISPKTTLDKPCLTNTAQMIVFPSGHPHYSQYITYLEASTNTFIHGWGERDILPKPKWETREKWKCSAETEKTTKTKSKLKEIKFNKRNVAGLNMSK